MDTMADERKVLADLLDKCVAELESRQKEVIGSEFNHFYNKQLLQPASFHHKGVSVHSDPTSNSIEPRNSQDARVTQSSYLTDGSCKSEERSRREGHTHWSNESQKSRAHREKVLTETLSNPPPRTSIMSQVQKLRTAPRRSTSSRRRSKGNLSVHQHETGFVDGTCFNLCSALLIISNAIFIGIQTHMHLSVLLHDGEHDPLPDWGPWEWSFLSGVILELGLRIVSNRLDFLRGIEWKWNVFDSVIVGLSILEKVAESILSQVGVNFPFLRLIRVVRVLRVLKVLHMVPFFRRLGLLMSSVSVSLSALAPAFVFLILLMYLFGICIMQGIINHIDKNNEPSDVLTSIDTVFGSVGVTMQTLFMSVTNGLSWRECVKVLDRIGVAYIMFFLFYVGFVQICVLNIVTGVFVDTVHQMYRPEREEIVQRELSKRKQVLQLIRTVFEEADEDCSGTITWEEFEECISDENIIMYLSSLEIDITQAREIFDIIDSEGKNEVGIDDVVIGFLEMKGAAKGADVVILRNNLNKLALRMSHFARETKRSLHTLKELMDLARRELWIVGSGLEVTTFTGPSPPEAVHCPRADSMDCAHGGAEEEKAEDEDDNQWEMREI